MIQFARALLAISAVALVTHAHADISSIDISGSASVPGENWAKGNTWRLRAILLDSSLTPIGKLSPSATFSTVAAPLTPRPVSIVLDASASVGTVIRVYRSASNFNPGDSEQYADITGICPCTKGDVAVLLPNGAFTSRENTLPVRLESYSVD